MEGDKKLFSTQDADAGPQNIRPLHGRTSGPTRRSTKGQWTAEEDEILCKAVQRYKGKNWKKIAECFKDRTDVQCLHRWQKVLNPELVKGPWSKEEDDIIIELVNKHGPKKWSTIAQHLPGRIGKQCRERWHNHLNPSINKEAWTQEEELALIRAHQIYGNKWAELTKFLPGRSDNSIKNHWNSSVKKKLDSYMASGLLEQFQGLRSSSLKMAQRSGDGSVGGHNGGNEGEEISECSQSSSAIGCSRTTSDMTDTVIHAGDDFLLTEESGQGKEESSSPASSPPQYHTSIEDVHVHIPEMPCDQNSSQIAGPSADGNFQFDLHEFPDISLLGLGREISPPVHCSSAIRDHEVLPAPSEGSERLNISASVDNMASGPIKSERLFIVNGGCYGVVLPERVNDECKLSRNHPTVSSMPNMGGGCPHPLIGQSSDYQILEPNQSHSLETREQVPVRNFSEGFICTDEFVNSPSEKVPDEPPKLVAVDSFNSRPSDLFQSSSPSVKESIVPKTEQQDAGTLFYEPPRFPSLDVPFFSCDLIQPGNDLQQEYSPLGIRQIMMSSMSCLTPFRLWDSPSRDDSPDAVLKCAAKTFNCTPSILKKRHRDLLSPLSERKCDKKLESDRNRGSFSSLARDFSRLDVMLGEDGNFPSSNQKRSSEPSVGDKENIYNSCQGEREGKGGGSSALSDARLSETISDRNSSDNAEKGTQAHVTTTAGERVEKPAEVLVEHNTNDIAFFSPDRVGYRAEHYQLIPHGNSSLPFAISPTVSGKKHDNLASSISMKSASSSTPLQTVVDNSKRDIGLENFSMFGGTPFKRSLESPSAWKSPWFINSFIPGPRVDTEITIEDIGYFMSPGENTYDALGLMKQLSAQTAAAYADAQEVLGNDTPDTIFKERLDDHNGENGGHDQEDRQPVKGSQFSSDVLMERRILDFSECGTPVRSKANFKSPTVIRSSSSPSSYLLKSCR